MNSRLAFISLSLDLKLHSLKVVRTDCPIITTALQATVFETGGLNGKGKDRYGLTFRIALYRREPRGFRA